MRRLLEDLGFVIVSVAVAVAIVRSDIVEVALAQATDGGFTLSFVAGMFFTSIFTAAPATAVLAELSHSTNILVLAVVGGLGSVLGDYAMYLFIRNRLLRDASEIMQKSRLHRILHVLQLRRYHRLLQLLGVIVLASPLPDEPALAMLGLSSIRPRAFFLLSFTTHAAGILAIGIIARSV